MRINSSKSIAALMAVCVGTLSSVTAMAANMVTTTTYTYGADVADANATVYVQSSVSGAEAGKQVTYLVSKANPANGSDIVFIDQKKAGSNGDVDFTFTAKQTDLYRDDYSIQAKVGTDSTDAGSQTTAVHKFTEGVNYYDGSGVPDPQTQENAGFTDESVTKLFGDSASGSRVVFAKLNGNPSGYEYGFVDANGNEYRAMGCGEDGLYCVVFNFTGANGLELRPYAKRLSTTSGN